MESEESKSRVIECPHCHSRIVPLANNLCPACREELSDLTDVNPNLVAFTLYELEDLPTFCYSCNQYTETRVRVSADQESPLEILFLGQAAPEDTSNVILYLPQCKQCAELGSPQIVEADYGERVQSLTLVVHKGFRERVLQMRSANAE